MFFSNIYILILPFSSQLKYFKKNALYSIFYIFLLMSIKKFKITFLPKNNYKFSSYMAPIAHKSFSKEHYIWRHYKIVIRSFITKIPLWKNFSILNVPYLFYFFKKYWLFGSTTAVMYTIKTRCKVRGPLPIFFKK